MPVVEIGRSTGSPAEGWGGPPDVRDHVTPHDEPMAHLDEPTSARSSRSAARRRPTLLGVWAHPDDEAYLSAGLMADFVRRGGRVVVVTAHAWRGRLVRSDGVATMAPRRTARARAARQPGDPRCRRGPPPRAPGRRVRSLRRHRLHRPPHPPRPPRPHRHVRPRRPDRAHRPPCRQPVDDRGTRRGPAAGRSVVRHRHARVPRRVGRNQRRGRLLLPRPARHAAHPRRRPRPSGDADRRRARPEVRRARGTTGHRRPT